MRNHESKTRGASNDNFEAQDVESTNALPMVTVLANSELDMVTREQVIAQKSAMRRSRYDASDQLRQKTLLHEERSDIYREAAHYYSRESELEELLAAHYLPQHSPQQFLNPRLFLVTPLFRVASRSAPREQMMELVLGDDNGTPITYVGPELRQGEGLVFMALINIARDVRAGVSVQFTVGNFCKALFGRYDGPIRSRVKEIIRRLQLGQIRTKSYTVQLCQRFEHPQSGPWSVALDKDIVHLFAQSNVWLKFNSRVEMSEGVASWLYGFVESQTSLIPMSITTIRNLCGSSATEKTFLLSLRSALKELASNHVIDPGYHVKNKTIHWRKSPRKGNTT